MVVLLLLGTWSALCSPTSRVSHFASSSRTIVGISHAA